MPKISKQEEENLQLELRFFFFNYESYLDYIIVFPLYYIIVVEQLFKTYLTFQATFQNYFRFMSRTLPVEGKMQVFLGFRWSPVFKILSSFKA